MHRSVAAALAGALALPISVLPVSPAVADHRPKPRTVGVTLKTDAMPTRVEATTLAGRVTCVKVTTGSGRDRRVWLTLDGTRDVRVYTRLDALDASPCLFAGAAAPRGSRLLVRVEEDVPGPFNPRARASLRL